MMYKRRITKKDDTVSFYGRKTDDNETYGLEKNMNSVK